MTSNNNALFQILLLDNDATDDVKVQEARQVNFYKVKEHLKNGGSVFITSKKTQKQNLPKDRKSQKRYVQTRQNYGSIIRKQIRNNINV